MLDFLIYSTSPKSKPESLLLFFLFWCVARSKMQISLTSEIAGSKCAEGKKGGLGFRFTWLADTRSWDALAAEVQIL